HTRWPRDWSSDVCSSDLVIADGGEVAMQHGLIVAGAGEHVRLADVAELADRSRGVLHGENRVEIVEVRVRDQLQAGIKKRRAMRSEERRVGKEGRDRWAT